MADKDFKVKQGLDLGIPLSISEGGTGQTSSTNAINALLPVQTGENGKFLTTDGTNTYWAIDNSGVSLNGGSTIISSTTSTKGLIVKAINSQTANIFEIQNPTGGIIFAVSPVAEVISYRRFNVLIPGASTIGSIIKGAPSQTANLQEWQDSASTVLSAINSSGQMAIGRSNTLGAASFTIQAITPISLYSSDNTTALHSRIIFLRGNSAGGSMALTSKGDTTNGVSALVISSGSFTSETIGFGVNGNIYTNIQSASTVGLTVKGAASQTADLQQWQNSSGTVLTKVDSTGQITSTNGTQFGTMGPAGFQSGGSSGIVDIHYNNGNLTIRGGSAYSSNTSLLVGTGYAGGIGQIIKGSASQTANLQEWQNSAGSIRLAVSSYGTLNSYTEAIFNNTLNGTGTALLVKTNNAGGKPLVVQGAASQTANLTEWQDSAPNTVAYINNGGGAWFSNSIGVGATPYAYSSMISISTSNVSNKGLVIRGYGSQTANLQEWQDSAGTVLSSVSAAGLIRVNNTNTDAMITATGNSTYDAFRFRNAGGLFLWGGGANNNIFYANSGTIALTGGNWVSGRLAVDTGSTGTVGIIVRGQASQTANLQEWQNSAGTVLARVTSDGSITTPGLSVQYGIYSTTVGKSSINLNYNTGGVGIYTENAANKGLVVRGFASQTANLQEWQNSDGTVLAKITPTGKIEMCHINGVNGDMLSLGSNAASNILVIGYSASIGTTYINGGQYGPIQVQLNSPTNGKFIIKGAASQTADLQQWQNSAGTVLAEITANGGLELNGKDIELITIAGAL